MGFNRPSKIQENALPMMLAEPYVRAPFCVLTV